MVTGLLSDHPDVISGMLSDLDGEVVARAINTEYARHPGSSLIERLLGSPHMSGADVADLLNRAGYQFLAGLLANLDPEPVAEAVNNAGEEFLTDLLAFMDPDLVVGLCRADRDPDYKAGIRGGALKDLNIHLFVYAAIGLPLPLGPAEFKVFDLGIYVPPDIPAMPPYPGPPPPW
ncbi:MAG: hypothetical protein H5T74_11880 [Actinobacteria bacterium]|nr:hypothetical protein [Actinomycetota bacterium]